MTHKDLVLKYTDALNDIADILDLPNGRSSENIVEAVRGMRDALLSASVMRAALDDCRSANFRDRFSTPSHPDGCPVLIAAALIKAESLLKEASEALESECESEQRDAWNDIRDFFEPNNPVTDAEATP